ncbi:MAG: NAD(P)H-hydrate dehydratase [Clostridia bacterium]|nr:NAD(P)H-hydrate dehydratase [Clostridia bacterium]
MQNILSVGEMRMSDAIAISSFVPGMELMRRAGEGIFRAAAWKPPVAVVCGTGNNAGDGFVTAMMLADAGIPCEILLREETFTGDGKFWFDCCTAKRIPVRMWSEIETLEGYGSVADCIFGTGFHGSAEGESARMIRLINESGAYVVSADINSGLNGDNGLAEQAVRSDLTVCIGSWQPGHFLNMAADLMREKVCVDIGIPPKGRGMQLMEAEDAAEMFPPRKHFSHKGDYGTVALMGGSLRYSGAVRLAALANAGMRAGAGIARLCAPRSLCEKMIPEILEATLFPLDEERGELVFREETFREALAGTRAAAFGMGAGNTEETRKAVEWLLRNYEGTLILDADGLNALAAGGCEALAESRGKVILTPHPGEFARLSGRKPEKIRNNPIPLAEEFARKHGVTLLLKGPATIITDGTKTILTDRGTPGMATGGSGDVLSGILSAVAAAHPDDPTMAAAAAAWINGRAGEIAAERMGDVSMTAGDTAAAVPEAIREIRPPEQKSPRE